MRCPKCQYISYDDGSRCRNCGYELSLSMPDREAELPIRTGEEAIGPMTDFPLTEPPPRGVAGETPTRTPMREAVERRVRAARAVSGERRGAASGDLPLFNTTGALREDSDSEAPLVSAPAVPRVPLAVRRNQVIARPREGAVEPGLHLEFPDVPEALVPGARRGRAAAADGEGDAVAPSADGLPATAPTWARLVAGTVDVVILGAINTLVLYLTLRICGFSLPQILLLPPVPLFGFLVVLDGAYLAAFTAAGGQTIGKMAVGVKVVQAANGTDRVRPGQAAIRAAGSMVSMLPVGLGFVPALISADRRALHDWLADTRVVNA